jgi:hypothetical protein
LIGMRIEPENEFARAGGIIDEFDGGAAAPS